MPNKPDPLNALRRYVVMGDAQGDDVTLFLWAADEIERLRSDVSQMRHQARETIHTSILGSTTDKKYHSVAAWLSALARDEINEQDAEIERLVQMLRDTGYGQGQIDAYAAQCEELDSVREALAESRNEIQRLIDYWVPLPQDMSGWDDETAPQELLFPVAEACTLHGVEMPPHVRRATDEHGEAE